MATKDDRAKRSKLRRLHALQRRVDRLEAQRNTAREKADQAAIAANLARSDRLLLVLELRGLASHAEMAEAMGMTVHGVTKMIERARDA